MFLSIHFIFGAFLHSIFGLISLLLQICADRPFVKYSSFGKCYKVKVTSVHTEGFKVSWTTKSLVYLCCYFELRLSFFITLFVLFWCQQFCGLYLVLLSSSINCHYLTLIMEVSLCGSTHPQLPIGCHLTPKPSYWRRGVSYCSPSFLSLNPKTIPTCTLVKVISCSPCQCPNPLLIHLRKGSSWDGKGLASVCTSSPSPHMHTGSTLHSWH